MANRKLTRTDAAIVALWEEIDPPAAFAQGSAGSAGRLFIPTAKNIEAARKKIAQLKKTADELQSKVLDSMDVSLEFMLREPEPIFGNVTQAILNHLTKEGINEHDLSMLMSAAIIVIEATIQSFKSKKVPVGIRVFALIALNALVGIIESVKAAVKGRDLKAKCDKAIEMTREAITAFRVDGFSTGRFEEIELIAKNGRFVLGREEFYPRALRKAFDYHETPDELEKKALSWLDGELVKFRSVVGELARVYGCEAEAEIVEKMVMKNSRLKASEIVTTISSVRKVVESLVNERVVKINKNYSVIVKETPGYLTRFVPGGIVNDFDTFAKQFNIWYMTTDDSAGRFIAATSIPEMLDMILHELYGHCLHFSNSANGFVTKPNILELLPTTHRGPISEGISLNREREFIDIVYSLESKGRKFSKAENEYRSLMERYEGLHFMNLQYEFAVRQWRLIRFLRVIGSIRINMGKQDLLEFLQWASKYTNIERRKLWYEIFPHHEGHFPGYATTYAVVEEEIRPLEEKIKDEEDRIKFSTYICSIGSPPRSIFRRMMKKFVRELVGS